MRIDFPEDFLWGAAVSAYQVEGGVDNADWSRFKPAGRACGHYRLFEKDFDLLEELNLNAYRFSLEWSRLEPEEGGFNPEEFDHYKKYLTSLKKRGVKTMATLHHFTNPLWFSKKGGWVSPRAPFYFNRFARKCFSELEGLVDLWVTINEPVSVYASLSYLKGRWPPQKRNPLLFLKVVRNQIKAHKLVYEAFHEEGEVRVGVAKNNQYFEPASFCPLSRAWTALLRYSANHFFLRRIKSHLDFIGVNYYFHKKVAFWPFGRKKRPLSDLGWEICPEGLYHVLKELKGYDLPVYITENGVADKKDELRADFIKNHLFWAEKAMDEGVDLKGYFYWSLLDNFEWDKGFKARFGLVEVDYETLKRRIRPSGRVYARIAEKNGFRKEA